jgi:hypothetical protein
MGMKASEVGDWLRQRVGRRDHHELMPEDYVVLRPGPNFHWLMGHPAAGQSTQSVPEQDLTGEDRSKTDDRGERGSSTRA